MKIIEDIKEFTVNRKKWFRGEGPDKSCLLNSNTGMKCCLGFYALQSGLAKKDIEDMPTPVHVKMLLDGEEVYTRGIQTISRPAKPIKWNTKLIDRNRRFQSKTGSALMDVNDNTAISDEVREKKITSLFKRIGVTVKFVG
jgi:hypothetical protein